MKRFYQHELEDLRTKLILIGEKANEAARIAVDGFLENDLGKIDQALALDDAIDALEVEIDQASVRYITLRSPVSSDVRFILVAIKASHDLERAGDEAHSIALRAKEILSSDGRSGNTVSIEQMSLLGCSMMTDAISALVEEDVELAKAVIATRQRSESSYINRTLKRSPLAHTRTALKHPLAFKKYLFQNRSNASQTMPKTWQKK